LLINPKLGLGLYTEPKQSARVSLGDDWTKPFLMVFDGVTGGSKDCRLYIGTNDEVHAYLGLDGAVVAGSVVSSGISVSLYCPIQATLFTDGFYWKLRTGDSRPTSTEWNAIATGNTIYVGDIINEFNNYDGGLQTYLPFWLRLHVPGYASVEMIRSIQVRIEGKRMDTGWRTA